MNDFLRHRKTWPQKNYPLDPCASWPPAAQPRYNLHRLLTSPEPPRTQALCVERKQTRTRHPERCLNSP